MMRFCLVIDGVRLTESTHVLRKKLTNGHYFIECPSCHFHNIHLVEICVNCSYKEGDPMTFSTSHISSNLKGDSTPSGLIPLLSLAIGEEIIFHKKLTLSSQQLKNGERIVRKHFVITTNNLITVDYEFFHIHLPQSWRERDVIPLSKITAVEGKMKEFMKDICPFLIIKTITNDIYEIVFSTFDDYIPQIKEISEIIKKINPQVKVEVDLFETSLTKSVKRLRSFLGRLRGRCI